MKAKVGETEESTREERIRKTSKEVVGYVQAMRGKNNFLVQFKYGMKRDMSFVYFLYVFSK